MKETSPSRPGAGIVERALQDALGRELTPLSPVRWDELAEDPNFEHDVEAVMHRVNGGEDMVATPPFADRVDDGDERGGDGFADLDEASGDAGAMPGLPFGGPFDDADFDRLPALEAQEDHAIFDDAITDHAVAEAPGLEAPPVDPTAPDAMDDAIFDDATTDHTTADERVPAAPSPVEAPTAAAPPSPVPVEPARDVPRRTLPPAAERDPIAVLAPPEGSLTARRPAPRPTPPPSGPPLALIGALVVGGAVVALGLVWWVSAGG